ncbi:MAG TPA: Gfo/Idh/MocA family oxidoreductase, partial [Chthonomonadales bacterium]|nr:Gfo/Idh/MocA family oxidoreductase [Chthonomonadales bacterium]
RYANGVIGTISNSRAAVYGYDQRVEVLGSAGFISIGNNYPNTAIIADAHSVRRDLPLYFFIERYTESFVSEMTAFVEAVRSGTPVAVTGLDGRIPVVMALAAQRSLGERRQVRLDEIE